VGTDIVFIGCDRALSKSRLRYTAERAVTGQLTLVRTGSRHKNDSALG
jgi:hypothetical protein